MLDCIVKPTAYLYLDPTLGAYMKCANALHKLVTDCPLFQH